MSAIATTEVGEGPAVLLVHGLNGFKEGWGGLPGALAAAGLRVVAADLPGFGATPALRRTSPRALADALVPLVDRLAPVAVVAHSLGTQVAMLAAATAGPAEVPRLVLLSPWVLPRPRRFPPRGITDVLQLPLVGRPLARLAIGRIRRSPERRREAYLSAIAHPDRLAGDPQLVALLDAASEKLLAADLGAIAGWAASGIDLDARPLAPELPQPTLVVSGMLDRLTRPAGATRLVSLLPAGHLLNVPDAGHFPHIEEPAVVLPAVVRHLT